MTTTLTVDSGTLVVEGIGGVTIQNVTPDTTAAPGTLITRDGPLTVVVVPPPTVQPGSYIQLPNNSQVGDTVEITLGTAPPNPSVNLLCYVSGYGSEVFLSASTPTNPASLIGFGGPTGINEAFISSIGISSITLRKISEAGWVVTSSALMVL